MKKQCFLKVIFRNGLYEFDITKAIHLTWEELSNCAKSGSPEKWQKILDFCSKGHMLHQCTCNVHFCCYLWEVNISFIGKSFQQLFFHICTQEETKIFRDIRLSFLRSDCPDIKSL